MTAVQAQALAEPLLRERGRRIQVTAHHATRGTVLVEPADSRSWTATSDGRHLFTTSNGPLSGAPTPTEMLVASAATCIAMRAAQLLAARGIGRDLLTVTAGFTEAKEPPARVTAIRISVNLPDGLEPRQKDRLRRELRCCNVTNNFRQPPHLTIDLR